jgi:hypothetical protein
MKVTIDRWSLLIDADQRNSGEWDTIWVPNGCYELERISNPRGWKQCGDWLVLKGTNWGHNEEFWKSGKHFKIEQN